MPLVSMREMLIKARAEHRGVGGFLAFNYDSARAIAETAKKLHQPAIYIVGDQMALDMGGFARVTAMARSIADELDVEIALHADHYRSYEMIVGAIRGGFTSVMIDASRFPLEKNIELTKEVVKVAHACGVSVEAEIGRLPGNEGDEEVTVAEAFQTDPDEAAEFAERTGIDALAVSIGTMHGAYPKGFKPDINIPRLREIAAKVSLPLVMHGGSGTPEDKIAEAVQAGIAKINVATDLVTAYQQKIYQLQADDPDIRHNLDLFAAAKEAVAQVVEERMKLFAGI